MYDALDLGAIEKRAVPLWRVGEKSSEFVSVPREDWEALLAELRRLRDEVKWATEVATTNAGLAETRQYKIECLAASLGATETETLRLRAAWIEDNEAATSRIWVAETERDQAQAEVQRLRAARWDDIEGMLFGGKG